jgi:hypothetical protein
MIENNNLSDTWDGRPKNPERDGWHWLIYEGEAQLDHWLASLESWWCGGMTMPATTMAAEGFSYNREVITPKEHTALLAERDALAKVNGECGAAYREVLAERDALRARVEVAEAAQDRHRALNAQLVRERDTAHIAARLAEAALATARTEAWKAGQEDMHQKAERKVEAMLWQCPNSGCTRIFDAIRALTPAPQEPGHAE